MSADQAIRIRCERCNNLMRQSMRLPGGEIWWQPWYADPAGRTRGVSDLDPDVCDDCAEQIIEACNAYDAAWENQSAMLRAICAALDTTVDDDTNPLWVSRGPDTWLLRLGEDRGLCFTATTTPSPIFPTYKLAELEGVLEPGAALAVVHTRFHPPTTTTA